MAGRQRPLALLLVIVGVISTFFLLRFRNYAFALVLLWAFYGVYLARPEVQAVVLGVILAAALIVLGGLVSLRSRRPAL